MKRYMLLTVIMLGTCLLAGMTCIAQDEGEGGGTPATKTTKSRGAPLDIELDFVLNVLPASILIDIDSDKFGITSPSGARTELSSVYVMPNFAAGVGAELGNFYVDLTAGAGIIVNESFRSFLVDAFLTGQYAFTDSLKMGPRAGIVYYVDPQWLGNEDLNFSEQWGYVVGLQLSMGDRIMYMVSVDLVFASFDAEVQEPGITADTDEAELTGLAAQFGVRGEF